MSVNPHRITLCCRILAWFGILLFFSNAFASLPARSGRSVFHGTGERDTLFVLPVIWVDFDSVRVTRNGDSLSEYSQWRITEPGNRIWIYRPLVRDDSVVISYIYRPIPLFKSYSRHSLRELGREIAAKDTSRILATIHPANNNP